MICAMSGGSLIIIGNRWTASSMKVCGSGLKKFLKPLAGEVVRVKYGRLQRAAFAEPGGDKLQAWIDACPSQDYSCP